MIFQITRWHYLVHFRNFLSCFPDCDWFWLCNSCWGAKERRWFLERVWAVHGWSCGWRRSWYCVGHDACPLCTVSKATYRYWALGWIISGHPKSAEQVMASLSVTEEYSWLKKFEHWEFVLNFTYMLKKMVSHRSAKNLCYDLYMALTYVISFFCYPQCLWGSDTWAEIHCATEDCVLFLQGVRF